VDGHCPRTLDEIACSEIRAALLTDCAAKAFPSRCVRRIARAATEVAP